MAKSQRQLLLLACSVCNRQNYTTSKNPTNVKDKLKFSKFCRFCKKHTTHNEVKIS